MTAFPVQKMQAGAGRPRRLIASLCLSALALACGTDGSAATAPAVGSGTLVITTEASVSSGVINVGGIGLVATVRNTSGRTVYTRAGDAFNAADEQDPFYASRGSDAEVEARSASGWTELETGVAVEGTKYIALKSGKSYRLIAVISAPTFRGQARIRVTYSTTPDASGVQAADYSNVFEIR